MISYSQKEMRRQIISDQHLWKRLPAAAAAILWPLEALLLGWETARWTGLATIAAVAIFAAVFPRALTVNLYLLDLMDRALRLPLWLGWLLLLWQLAAREPLYSLFGVPAAGAVAVTTLTWIVSWVVILALGFAARRTVARGGAAGA